jgi:hypothetical protein
MGITRLFVYITIEDLSELNKIREKRALEYISKLVTHPKKTVSPIASATQTDDSDTETEIGNYAESADGQEISDTPIIQIDQNLTVDLATVLKGKTLNGKLSPYVQNAIFKTISPDTSNNGLDSDIIRISYPK